MTRLLRTWFLREWFDFTEGGQEDGESPEQALVREIHEELDAGVAVDGFLTTVEWVHIKRHADTPLLYSDFPWKQNAVGKQYSIFIAFADGGLCYTN